VATHHEEHHERAQQENRERQHAAERDAKPGHAGNKAIGTRQQRSINHMCEPEPG
jgi:hypothetical protein